MDRQVVELQGINSNRVEYSNPKRKRGNELSTIPRSRFGWQKRSVSTKTGAVQLTATFAPNLEDSGFASYFTFPSAAPANAVSGNVAAQFEQRAGSASLPNLEKGFTLASSPPFRSMDDQSPQRMSRRSDQTYREFHVENGKARKAVPRHKCCWKCAGGNGFS